MNILEHKLDCDNPIRMAQVFSHVYENACEPQTSKAALDYLKLKCKSDNPLISEMSADILVKLAQENRIDIDLVLADFAVLLMNIRSTYGIIRVVASLSLLNQQKKFDTTKILPKINLAQHPFVKILKDNAATQVDIFNEILQNYEANLGNQLLVTKLYEPVYLYTICHPDLRLNLSFIRDNLWSILLNHSEISRPTIFKLLCWMQTEKPDPLPISSVLLIKLLESSINVLNDVEIEVVVLKSISLLHQMIQNRQHCLYMLQILKKVCLKVELLSIVDVALLILSESIMSCSFLYLMDLLELCIILIQKDEISCYSNNCLKFACLNWIGNPSSLTKSAKISLTKILALLNMKQYEVRKNKTLNDLSIKYSYLLESDAKISLAMHVCLRIKTNKNYLEWLTELEMTPVFFIRNIFHILCGLRLDKNLTLAVHEKLISLTSKCVETNYRLAYYSLVLTLYQLSDPHYSLIHFKLLKSLPKLACLKENGPKVAATLHALSAHPELRILATKLMFSMWETDKSYYHNLETLINMEKPVTLEEHTKSIITNALILKQLCDLCPHLYGKDIIPRLSKILNDCNNIQGAVPCALAIEGITALCKHGVIDVITTWTNLLKKYNNEARVPVIKSLCLLISAIPELQYTEAYENLNQEVLEYLWQYVSNNDNEEVVAATFNALSCFNFEVMSAHLPDKYLDESFKPSVDQAKSIPGSTWINLLSNHRFHEAVRNFLIKLVSTEIENYLKYVYQVKGQGEPSNYNYLPSHSIVRALCTHLKKNIDKIEQWENNSNQHRLFVDCLYIFSRKYCRSLPPLDWCFLQELIHEPKLRLNCLEVACHQVIISGSARRLVENFMVACTSEPQVKEILILYENLDFLANSIQPVTFKPFIEVSLDFAIKMFNNDAQFLEELVDHLKSTLKNGDVQDINKQSVADVLNVILSEVDVSSSLFTLLLEIVANAPSKNQEEICRYSFRFEKNDFIRKSKMRCFLATYLISDLSINWLNDVIEIGSKNNIRGCIFRDFIEVFKRKTSNLQNVFWFVEVLGQIQAKITIGCPQIEIAYYCDILLLASVSFSGYFALMEPDDTNNMEENHKSLKRLFPQALATLMIEESWSENKAQVLEFLYYLNLEEAIPSDYQCIFGQALCALRHDVEFSKNLRWMKYMDCDITTY